MLSQSLQRVVPFSAVPAAVYSRYQLGFPLRCSSFLAEVFLYAALLKPFEAYAFGFPSAPAAAAGLFCFLSTHTNLSQ